MPNESASDDPTANTETQSLPEAPLGSPLTPKQDEVRKHPECCTDNKTNNADTLEQDIRNGERWLIGINGSLVVITIIIAVIYYGQLCQMRKATKAAEGANQVARNALESVQRAFVTFSPNCSRDTRIENGRVTYWSFEIPVINNGDTSARDLTYNATPYTSHGPLPDSFAFADGGPPHHIPLGPKQSFYVEVTVGITDVQLAQKGWDIYVYGWTSYWDIFQMAVNPRPRPHRAEFLYRYRLNSIPGDVTSPKYKLPGRFLVEDRHNCEDDCPD